MTRINIRDIISADKRGGSVKSYSSREVVKMLKEDGWYEVACVGDHHQFKHPSKPGRVTVTHPVKDMPIRDLKSIERQAGLKIR